MVLQATWVDLRSAEIRSRWSSMTLRQDMTSTDCMQEEVGVCGFTCKAEQKG